MSPESTEKNRTNVRNKVRRRAEWLRKIKQTVGCDECGYNDHAIALQFAHIDPTTKLGNVSQAIHRKLTFLFAEIRKCRVLCANCHAIETHAQFLTNKIIKGRPRLNVEIR